MGVRRTYAWHGPGNYASAEMLPTPDERHPGRGEDCGVTVTVGLRSNRYDDRGGEGPASNAG